jgi:hypothetical protein
MTVQPDSEMTEQQRSPIRPFRPSYTSLLLHTEVGGVAAKQATGFVVVRDGRSYLISNGHVFSGRNPLTKLSDHCPDAVRFKYWRSGEESSLVEHREILQKNNEPCWFEHPVHGAKVDVAALPINGINLGSIAIHDPWRPPYVQIGVGDDVTIVGFPFGVNTESLAIWTRASVASEYEVDYDGLPVYLVDARTRPGQSGSPVLFFKTGSYFDKYGSIVMSMTDQRFVPVPGQPISPNQPRPDSGFTEEFLGVYSWRVNAESDIGFVWRPSALREIVEGRRLAKW